ncbi:hypothetical protein IAT38_002549 [Cryptococcus sp. DSM 104549]
MALRSQILTSALPLLPIHSFTRPALLSSLRSLKPEVSDPDAVLDTIFGAGQVGCGRALVERWEEVGREEMAGEGAGVVGKGVKGLEEVLSRRLEYSAVVGEHLVEAYANLTTPRSSPSMPLPSLPTLKRILSSLQATVPPAYHPPSSPYSSVTPSTSPSPSFPTHSDDRSVSTRLPLLTANPLGPLAYAWRIADEALYLVQQAERPSGSAPGASSGVGQVKRGYWNEPVGPGPEWYGKRVGLMAVYLSAESHLLQPYPQPTTTTYNPHLPQALASLRRNLARYAELGRSVENAEANVGDAMGFVDYVARSWRGLIKSRYW